MLFTVPQPPIPAYICRRPPARRTGSKVSEVPSHPSTPNLKNLPSPVGFLGWYSDWSFLARPISGRRLTTGLHCSTRSTRRSYVLSSTAAPARNIGRLQWSIYVSYLLSWRASGSYPPALSPVIRKGVSVARVVSGGFPCIAPQFTGFIEYLMFYLIQKFYDFQCTFNWTFSPEIQVGNELSFQILFHINYDLGHHFHFIFTFHYVLCVLGRVHSEFTSSCQPPRTL